MIITKINQQKRNLDNENIFLDEKYWISLSKTQLINFSLFKGKEINNVEKLDLEKASTLNKIIFKVQSLILRRPRSEKEIHGYLRYKQNLSEEELKTAIHLSKEKNYINDESFTEWFIKQRLEFGLSGDNKIKSELIKKGITSAIITKTLKRLINDENELLERREERLKEEIIKLKTQFDKLDLWKMKEKIFRRLLSRGFSYDEIKGNFE
ncbi:MAG: RecX family transcriptional regulator [Candidatus Dojkabacteria bacterium]|nr:RecX family transcriptional regulator [Candidatus Dojkabacteria bacterium]MDQ7021367.1 RecX family transcriptional regulator [Candidatus Dojkabacteria bacterium]